MNIDLEQQTTLIQALLNPAVFSHYGEVSECSLIETHVSWIILTGRHAYKIKKPLNLGFLDFSTLTKRKYYCDEEIRLNRRLAPTLYLGVIGITGSPADPTLHALDKPISGSSDLDYFEYAVKMNQFPQEAQIDRKLSSNNLLPRNIDAIANMIADFHQCIRVSDNIDQFGTPEHVMHPVRENFKQIRDNLSNGNNLPLISQLEEWCNSKYLTLKPLLVERKVQGFIRECHGDLHLRNLAWVDDAPLAFDCLEFNPDLYWIDVINEIAFLVMDLDDHEQPAMAQRLLNSYLEKTGDYMGVTLLPFYLVYRALVRAKIDAIRANQSTVNAQEKVQIMQEFKSYLRLAYLYTQNNTPRLIITRGLSGSGKTTNTQALLESIKAIRIRSDVERKRLLGNLPKDKRISIEEGIYSQDSTHKTYQILYDLAKNTLASGYSVIVDATFISLEKRLLFKKLSDIMRVPFVILEFTASSETLRKRIALRHNDASDADSTVLDSQLTQWQALEEYEQAYTISIDTEKQKNLASLIEKVESICAQQTRSVIPEHIH